MFLKNIFVIFINYIDESILFKKESNLLFYKFLVFFVTKRGISFVKKNCIWSIRLQSIKKNTMTYVVAMSGGIDSAIAAYLMKKKGKVIALFMKNWEGECSAEEDFKDVQKICSFLEIDYYLVNYSKEYEQKVFKNFVQEWKEGKTPNPDILCNKEIKFDALLKEALKIGDVLVTGHYAKVDKGILSQAKDSKKDQTYFLHQLTKDQLMHVHFPLGDFFKQEVKELAIRINLPIQDKKESMGICFIGKKKMKDFLRNYIEDSKGVFIESSSGKILGHHLGIHFYTRGQRKGIGLSGGPYVVLSKDVEKKIVYLTHPEDPKLYTSEIFCEPIHWIDQSVEECLVKYRHQGEEVDCRIIDNHVFFKKPQKSLSEGQYVVFYKDSLCLGGSKIISVR